MTQILWPSKQPAVGPAPEAPVSAPMPPACPEPAPPAPAAVAQPVVPLRNDYTPNLEQATMEELNAALAYAFSQVSSGPAPAQAKRDSVTHLMPGPLPTSALRYGQAPAFAGA